MGNLRRRKLRRSLSSLIELSYKRMIRGPVESSRKIYPTIQPGTAFISWIATRPASVAVGDSLDCRPMLNGEAFAAPESRVTARLGCARVWVAERRHNCLPLARTASVFACQDADGLFTQSIWLAEPGATAAGNGPVAGRFPAVVGVRAREKPKPRYSLTFRIPHNLVNPATFPPSPYICRRCQPSRGPSGNEVVGDPSREYWAAFPAGSSPTAEISRALYTTGRPGTAGKPYMTTPATASSRNSEKLNVKISPLLNISLSEAARRLRLSKADFVRKSIQRNLVYVTQNELPLLNNEKLRVALAASLEEQNGLR